MGKGGGQAGRGGGGPIHSPLTPCSQLQAGTQQAVLGFMPLLLSHPDFLPEYREGTYSRVGFVNSILQKGAIQVQACGHGLSTFSFPVWALSTIVCIYCFPLLLPPEFPRQDSLILQSTEPKLGENESPGSDISTPS